METALLSRRLWMDSVLLSTRSTEGISAAPAFRRRGCVKFLCLCDGRRAISIAIVPSPDASSVSSMADSFLNATVNEYQFATHSHCRTHLFVGEADPQIEDLVQVVLERDWK